MGILFVGGVHGIGKSTCCQQVADRSGVFWFTASDLIKAESKSAIAEDSKRVLNPVENQELLICGIRKQIRAGHERILLDGHFTLLKANGEVTAIELDVFRQLGLEGIVMFQDDPVSIFNRLRARDGQNLSIPRVKSHQDSEIEQGHLVASNLKIPIMVLDAFDADGLEKATNGHWPNS